MAEDRLIQIETKIAFQEEAMSKLSDVLRAQQQQIDQLEATCKLLVGRLSNLEHASPAADPLDEKPPHY